jgi:hypothetical protein
MGDTMLIQLTDKKAAKLMHTLQELNIIKILEENISRDKNSIFQSQKISVSLQTIGTAAMLLTASPNRCKTFKQ